MPKLIAPILFAIGIMVAITGGAKVPKVVKGWPDSWPMFVVGAVVALIGLVLWRMQKAADRQASASGETADEHDPFRLLDGLLEPARVLRQKIGDLDKDAVCAEVDILLENYILPLAMVRQRIIDRLGMAAGAEVLVTVAYGERMLNRTWSAAADGHLPEANSVFPDAVDAFEEASRMVAKATS